MEDEFDHELDKAWMDAIRLRNRQESTRAFLFEHKGKYYLVSQIGNRWNNPKEIDFLETTSI